MPPRSLLLQKRAPQQDTSQPIQELPPWLTYASATVTDPTGGVSISLTVLNLPLTYYGPSIPLPTDGSWTWGGISSPPPVTSTSTSSFSSPTSSPPITSTLSSSTSPSASSSTFPSTSSSSTPISTSSFFSSPTITLSPSSTPASTTSSVAQTTTSFPSRGLSNKDRTGIIVGSVLGAVALVILAILAWFCIRVQRNRRRARGHDYPPLDVPALPRNGVDNDDGWEIIDVVNQTSSHSASNPSNPSNNSPTRLARNGAGGGSRIRRVPVPHLEGDSDIINGAAAGNGSSNSNSNSQNTSDAPEPNLSISSTLFFPLPVGSGDVPPSRSHRNSWPWPYRDVPTTAEEDMGPASPPLDGELQSPTSPLFHVTGDDEEPEEHRSLLAAAGPSSIGGRGGSSSAGPFSHAARARDAVTARQQLGYASGGFFSRIMSWSSSKQSTKSAPKRDSNVSYHLPLDQEDPSSPPLSPSLANPPPTSFAGSGHLRRLSGLVRPISSYSSAARSGRTGRSGKSGNTIYHDASSDFAPPTPPSMSEREGFTRAFIPPPPVSAVGGSMPRSPLSRPYSDDEPLGDVLDEPAPMPTIRLISGDRDAIPRRPSFEDYHRTQAWDSGHTPSHRSQATLVDLEEEPPTVAINWRRLTGAAGGSFGNAGELAEQDTTGQIRRPLASQRVLVEDNHGAEHRLSQAASLHAFGLPTSGRTSSNGPSRPASRPLSGRSPPESDFSLSSRGHSYASRGSVSLRSRAAGLRSEPSLSAFGWRARERSAASGDPPEDIEDPSSPLSSPLSPIVAARARVRTPPPPLSATGQTWTGEHPWTARPKSQA